MRLAPRPPVEVASGRFVFPSSHSSSAEGPSGEEPLHVALGTFIPRRFNGILSSGAGNCYNYECIFSQCYFSHVNI